MMSARNLFAAAGRRLAAFVLTVFDQMGMQEKKSGCREEGDVSEP
ncbi:hypothetical protein [Virgibacillus senegalensis]|nr:hypothetical protein [Virgibacillus senegalensis]